MCTCARTTAFAKPLRQSHDVCVCVCVCVCTGEFVKDLTDNVSDFGPDECAGLIHWRGFYRNHTVRLHMTHTHAHSTHKVHYRQCICVAPSHVWSEPCRASFIGYHVCVCVCVSQEYKFRGRLAGAFYDSNGQPTEELARVEKKVRTELFFLCTHRL